MKFQGLLKPACNSLEDESEKNLDVRVCSRCGSSVLKSDLRANLYICPECNAHLMMRARRRIEILCDKSSFVEIDKGMESENLLGFPGYEDKIRAAKEKSRENEAVVCGKARIGGNPLYIFVMEPSFMMGSMGSIVGEKITRCFEKAIEEKLPVLGITVSGGARMQEGIFSLMQMTKVSAAVKRHDDAGLLYMALLTNPTTGGVDASFAMQADIILAEPGARVGFAGPRVIEQTYRKKLPDGFQRLRL